MTVDFGTAILQSAIAVLASCTRSLCTCTTRRPPRFYSCKADMRCRAQPLHPEWRELAVRRDTYLVLADAPSKGKAEAVISLPSTATSLPHRLAGSSQAPIDHHRGQVCALHRVLEPGRAGRPDRKNAPAYR